MFDIYNITVEKLKEVGLYLDFGQYDNAIGRFAIIISLLKRDI